VSADLVALARASILEHDGPEFADGVGAAVADTVRAAHPLLARREREEIGQRVWADLVGLGPLEPWLADPDVSEVMVNAGREVWIDRGAGTERAGSLAAGQVDALLERIIGPLGLRVDRTSPIVDARLADGSRVSAVIPPLALDGTCLAIRRFRLRQVDVAAFAPPPVADVLRELVQARCNVVVSGATSSGKTTLLNALAASFDESERIVTIEDTAELSLRATHVVRLEARPASSDGVGGASMRDLVRASLRLRPDRLVVGEVRGAEALDMVQALNTGHDGSLSTCHANGPSDALRRLETMVLQGGATVPLAAVRDMVQSSIDAVVHVTRSNDGRRRVAEVAELLPPGCDPSRRVRAVASAVARVGELTRRRTP
jgi:pilus assembly protein CpaF